MKQPKKNQKLLAQPCAISLPISSPSTNIFLRSLPLPIRGLVLGTNAKIEGYWHESVARNQTIVKPCRYGIESYRVGAFLKPYKAAMRAAECSIPLTTTRKNLQREMRLFRLGRLSREQIA